MILFEREKEEEEAIARAEEAKKEKLQKLLEELWEKAREMWGPSDEFVVSLQKLVGLAEKQSLGDLEKEIVRLEEKREKIAQTLQLSSDAPVLQELDEQIDRLRGAQESGWHKEEK